MTDPCPRSQSHWNIAYGASATAAALFVAGLAVAAFANSFAGNFVFDDIVEIAGNPALDVLWPIWEPMTAGNRMPARFLPYLSFAVDRRLWGVSPAGFHATNLLVHVIAAVALYQLVRITLASPRLGGRFEPVAVPLAAAVAAIWAVHPLQTQAVTYVYQRIESLAGMFSLVSLACFARGAATGWPRAWLAGCVAACAAAMASKESAVVLPLVILAYDWFFVAGEPAEITGRRRLYGALAATWGVVALALVLERGRYQEFGDEAHPPLAYLLTQPGVILHYLRLAFWPVGQCLDYDWPIATSGRAILLPACLVVAAAVVTVAGTWLRRPWAWPGVAFFLLLAPTSSIMPVAAPAAEHRMYLPLAAVAGLVIVGGFALAQRALDRGAAAAARPAWPWVFAAALIAAVVALVAATHRRNEIYADADAIWQDVLDGRPDQYMAHFMLACSAARRGDLAGAEAHAARSVRSRPRSRVYAELASDRARHGESAEAERLLRQGIALQEELLPAADAVRLSAQVVLATMLHDQGRDREAEAICAPLLEPLERVLGAGHPTTVTARTLLAHAARGRGDLAAVESVGRENLRTARRSLGDADPATQAAVAPLAEALVDAGRTREAETLLRDVHTSARRGSWLSRVDVTAVSRLLADLLERTPAADRLAEAEGLRRSVYERLSRRLGPGDPQVGRAAVALGNARALRADAEQRHDDARLIAAATLEAAVARLGLPDPQTQRAAVALAAALYRTGQADAAERLLKDYLTDATRRREAGGGRDAPPTLVRNALAGLWEQADRLDEAIALRKKILRDSLDRHGPDHPATQQAAEVLKAAMHERQNREHAGGGERDALTDTAAP